MIGISSVLVFLACMVCSTSISTIFVFQEYYVTCIEPHVLYSYMLPNDLVLLVFLFYLFISVWYWFLFSFGVLLFSFEFGICC